MFLNAEPHEFDDLSTEASLSEALSESASGPVVIFKHSNICGLSSRANGEMRRFRQRHDCPVFRLTVQHARGVSDAIESLFGIRHQTPQAIVVVDGRAVFHVSHREVTASNLAKALASGEVE